MEAEETTEHLGADALHQAEAGMPQLDPTYFPNLVFWLLISLGLLYLMLTRVALPRIGNVIAERNDAIANDIEAAALYRRRADEAEAAYKKALAEAREQSQKITAENKAQINKELQTLMAKADAEIAAKTAESEKRIGEIQDSAARSVEQVVRETTADIVNAFLPGVADEKTIDAAISKQLKG